MLILRRVECRIVMDTVLYMHEIIKKNFTFVLFLWLTRFAVRMQKSRLCLV